MQATSGRRMTKSTSKEGLGQQGGPDFSRGTKSTSAFERAASFGTAASSAATSVSSKPPVVKVMNNYMGIGIDAKVPH